MSLSSPTSSHSGFSSFFLNLVGYLRLVRLVRNCWCAFDRSVLDVCRVDFHTAGSKTPLRRFQRRRLTRSNPGWICERMGSQLVHGNRGTLLADGSTVCRGFWSGVVGKE